MKSDEDCEKKVTKGSRLFIKRQLLGGTVCYSMCRKGDELILWILVAEHGS